MNKVGQTTFIAMAVYFVLALVWPSDQAVMVSVIQTLVFGMFFGAINAAIVIFGKHDS